MRYLTTFLLALAIGLVSSHLHAQTFLFGPSGLNAEGVDIGGGGGATDTQVNNTTEGINIYNDWVTAGKPASGPIGAGPIYNVTSAGGTTVSQIDFGGNGHEFAPTNPFPGGASGDDFIVHVDGVAAIKAGTYTISLEGDDGSNLIFNTLAGDDVVFFNRSNNTGPFGPNEIRFEAPTGNSNSRAAFTLTQDSVFAIEGTWFERGGGEYWEVGIAPGDVGALPPGNGFEIFGDGSLNGDLLLFQSAVEVVPEPASIAIWSLIGLGLGGFGYYRTRRKK